MRDSWEGQTFLTGQSFKKGIENPFQNLDTPTASEEKDSSKIWTFYLVECVVR